MPRREFSKAVQRAAFHRAEGHCEGQLPNGTRCPCPLTPAKFAYDHIVPDALGGEPTLTNCQVLCMVCHAEKTRADVARISKAKRAWDRHHGILDPHRRKIRGRGFPKAAPQRLATRPLRRWFETGVFDPPVEG
ncbi:HNH endonuclease [Methylobacterium sp. A54F]